MSFYLPNPDLMATGCEIEEFVDAGPATRPPTFARDDELVIVTVEVRRQPEARANDEARPDSPPGAASRAAYLRLVHRRRHGDDTIVTFVSGDDVTTATIGHLPGARQRP